MPNASRKPSGMAIRTRYQPGAVHRERGWWTGAWGWAVAAAVAMWSVLLSGLLQVLYERRNLRGTEARLEILRHHALREPRFDLRVRVLDRLLYEGRSLGRDAVQLRPDGA